jgi:hypothetical protein
MKKLGVVIIGLVMVFALAACSSVAVQEDVSQGTEAITEVEVDEIQLPERGELELPDNVQLMVGTFLLEDTEDAVTSVQAAELVILWKAFRSLSSSDNVAVEEMNALLNQIQDSMTSAQLDAIAGMEIAQEDMFAMAQELGIVPEDFAGFGRGEGDGEGFSEGRPGGFPGGGFPEGGFPGGGGPGGQGPGGFGGELDPEAIATLRAERGGGPGFGGRFNSFLLDPLIELLESKITT